MDREILNGSPGGITAVTTPDGRVTGMMPHPERVFRSVQIRISIGNDFILENLETTDAGGGVVVIPGYEIEVGLVSDLPANIRAQRQAPDIRFQAVLASAIHKVIVRGVLSI